MTIKEFLLNTLLPTLESLGESKLEELLDQLSEKEGENFALDVIGTYNLFTRLSILAKKTKSKIDDGIIDTVIEALEATAEKHDIDLPTKD